MLQQGLDLDHGRLDRGGPAAQQFDHVGIGLVGHDGGTRDVGFRQDHEVELTGGEQAQVPGQAPDILQRVSSRLQRQ